MSDRNSRASSRGYRRRISGTMTAPALVLALLMAGCGNQNEAGNTVGTEANSGPTSQSPAANDSTTRDPGSYPSPSVPPAASPDASVGTTAPGTGTPAGAEKK